MATIHDRAIAEAESKLVALLGEAKQTPGLFPRVEAWVQRMCAGRKLADFLHDETVKPVDRVTVARSLVEILLKPDHSRLPEVEAPKAVPVPAVASLADDDPPTPAPDELRAMIRQEVRRELASVLETVAKILRETSG